MIRFQGTIGQVWLFDQECPKNRAIHVEYIADIAHGQGRHHAGHLRGRDDNFAPEIQTVIQNMDQDPLKWVLFDWPSSSRWNFSGGKVALLEDAANAICPHQGMPSYPPPPLSSRKVQIN
ncbi:Aromatic-ring hydroxylase-like [Ilyonectria robusta]